MAGGTEPIGARSAHGGKFPKEPTKSAKKPLLRCLRGLRALRGTIVIPFFHTIRVVIAPFAIESICKNHRIDIIRVFDGLIVGGLAIRSAAEWTAAAK